MNLSTLSITELWHLGKKQYRDGSYKAALETFLTLSKKDQATIELLEYLTSSFAKLDRLGEALQTGRHMISLNSRDARGYLCTGKVLSKMNQKKRAIAIYDIGASKVLPTDPNLSKLAKARDFATGTVVSSTHKDPLSLLPAELLLQIFQFIGFRETLKCLRVSKTWRSFLTSWPELWMTLDLSQSKREIRPKLVNNYIRYSSYKLKHFISGRFSHAQTYTAISKCCKNIKSLELSEMCRIPSEHLLTFFADFKSLESISLGTIVNWNSFSRILYMLPNLTEARFSCVDWSLGNDNWIDGFKNDSLRKLECCFTNSDLPPQSSLTELFAKFESLETLILENMAVETPMDFRDAKSLRSLQLSKTEFGDDVRFPPSLTVLMVGGLDGKRLSFQQLPNLERLEIGNCKKPQMVVEKLLCETFPSDINDDAMLNIWRGTTAEPQKSETSFSRLKTFKIECKQYLADVFHGIMRREDDIEETLSHPRLSQVENMVLKGGGIDDNLLESLIQDRPTFTKKLVQAAFDTTWVTGVTIKLLVEKESSLKAIWLVNCDRVGSDAVQWAISKGVDVHVRRRC